jgi:hypothetical protein
VCVCFAHVVPFSSPPPVDVDVRPAIFIASSLFLCPDSSADSLALRVELMGFNDFAIPVGKFGFGIFIFYIFSRKEGRLSGGGNP